MKNVCVTLSFLLFSLFSFANEEVSKLIETGKLSEVSGDYNAAIEAYQSVIALDSQSYNAHLFLGNVYHIQNDFVSALIEYSAAIKIDKSKAEAYFYRGNLQIDLGSTFGAINDYTMAIERDPNQMNYYMCRGFVYANSGDYYSAISDYSIAIQIDAESAASYFNMAKMQGLINNEAMVCNKIIEYKDKGDVRAEVVFLNFCIV